MTVDADAGDIIIDFAGSSGPSGMGINVVPAYTHAYATFAVRSTLNPELPNNAGSLTPIKIKLPDECIVNARYPSPVNARHVVGTTHKRSRQSFPTWAMIACSRPRMAIAGRQSAVERQYAP